MALRFSSALSSTSNVRFILDCYSGLKTSPSHPATYAPGAITHCFWHQEDTPGNRDEMRASPDVLTPAMPSEHTELFPYFEGYCGTPISALAPSQQGGAVHNIAYCCCPVSAVNMQPTPPVDEFASLSLTEQKALCLLADGKGIRMSSDEWQHRSWCSKINDKRIRLLNSLAQQLKAKLIAAGMLNLALPEVKIHLDSSKSSDLHSKKDLRIFPANISTEDPTEPAFNTLVRIMATRHHWMAQMAGHASIKFYVELVLKGRNEREKKVTEDAFVIRTFRNVMFKWDTQFDAENYTISVPLSNTGRPDVTISVFDKVIVRIEVDKDKNTQRGQVKMTLLAYPPLSGVMHCLSAILVKQCSKGLEMDAEGATYWPMQRGKAAGAHA
ncbi:uncharacterized protein F5147DRAFT_652772 [Suillus discolor]|uniref:Exosome complex exonuclease RRP44 S1 domain-containing protein n=1 Tax=Suillus discolor TaxID=1912936 RepID=A0A9P7F812_9AGAM|nr:uncharacterized protein F5147DRAFT_652772 [Suillus discolor]KAG2108392.1 hypothetical protein F5147DRAFT_652772 [Suillus discolor]